MQKTWTRADFERMEEKLQRECEAQRSKRDKEVRERRMNEYRSGYTRGRKKRLSGKVDFATVKIR